MDAAEEKKIIKKMNKVFLILDPILTVICLILTFIMISEGCVRLMFLYYAFLFAMQTLQHYLIE